MSAAQIHAAQDQGSPAKDVVGELLHALPGRAVDLIAAMPPWLQMVIVVVFVLTFCVPRLLRALDDHLFNREARRQITRGTDWVEIIRIRNEPRKMFGRRSSPPRKATSDDPPETAPEARVDEDQPP